MYGCENQWTSEAAQSCLTLCDPMDCSLPASSIHRIFQARVLDWVVISFSRGSPQPRDQTQVSCITGRHFTIWTTREAWVLELDYKESIALENWCFWTVVLEMTLESLLDSKIKPVNPKWNQSWMFIERTGAEAETPILWLPCANNWLFEKDPDAGEDWRQEEKGTTEDEIVGWHQQLTGHEFEQAPGIGDGQASMACCSPWGRIVRRDWVTELNWLTAVVFSKFAGILSAVLSNTL